MARAIVKDVDPQRAHTGVPKGGTPRPNVKSAIDPKPSKHKNTGKERFESMTNSSKQVRRSQP